MDKRELKRQLTVHAKGSAVISRLKIEEFLGIGSNRAYELLNGLEVVVIGDRKKYFISDVAERILERCSKT